MASETKFEVYNVETGETRITAKLPAAIRECFASDPTAREVHDIRSRPARIFRRVAAEVR